MENPATWGQAEKIISAVIRDDDEATANGIAGWSLPKQIAEALRDAGLIARETTQERELTHLVPPTGQHITPCCGRSPFDLPRWHRMTLNVDDVTCGL